METNFKKLEMYILNENAVEEINEKEIEEINGGGYYILVGGTLIFVDKEND